MSPKLRPRGRPAPKRSSLVEYRNESGTRLDKLNPNDAMDAVYAGSLNPEWRAFWRYTTSPLPISGDPLDVPTRLSAAY